MNDADIFHEFLKTHYSFPGRDTLKTPRSDGFKEIAKKMIAAQRRLMPEMPEVYFDFILHPQLQAWSFRDKNPDTKRWRYFIGVFSGAVYMFSLVFSRMLADRRILPQIGKFELESEDPQSLLGMTRDAETDYLAGLIPTRPRCPRRAEYVDRLQELLFRFLIIHELAHIADGHVDFLDRNRGSKTPAVFIAEVGATGGTKADNLIRQSLEAFADAQGASNLIANVPRNVKKQNYSMTLEECVFQAVFALCCFNRIFGDQSFTGNESTEEYPTYRVRQAMCIASAQEIINTWRITVRKSCLDEVQKALIAVEQSFALLKGEPTSVDGLMEAFGPKGEEYSKRLKKKYYSHTARILKNYRNHNLI